MYKKYFKKSIKAIAFKVLIGSFIPACMGQNTSNHFTIHGKVVGRDTGRLVLFYHITSEKTVSDTTTLKSGYFNFSGTVDEPTEVLLIGNLHTSSRNDPNLVRFYVYKDKTSIILTENDYKNAKIIGSSIQQENEALNSQLKPVMNVLLPLDREYTLARKAFYVQKDTSAATKIRIKELQQKIKPILNQRDQIYYKFVLSHPDSYVSASVLNMMDLTKLSGDSAIYYYNSLTSRIKNSIPGRDVYQWIETQMKARQASSKGGVAAIDSLAPDFSKKDISDHEIRLSNFKGKNYVLLDFWASWCPPCRAAMPHLKELYKKYYNNGLQVIGISLDFNRKDWIAAINLDGLKASWPQIYAGFDNQPANFAKYDYGVLTIPQYILIDKTGKIIGRYEGLEGTSKGVSLSNQLNSIFQEKL